MRLVLLRRPAAWLGACLLALTIPLASAATPPALIVLTDIGGDPDDMQSMRRLLLYSNDIDIVGLIASASGTPGEVGREIVRPDLIREIVDDYEAAWDRLRTHDDRYPHPNALRRVIRSGSPQREVEALAAGRATEGSSHIVSTVDAAPGPVYVAIWGGAHDLAQALLDVRDSRPADAAGRFAAKLRVYAIADQDAWGGRTGTGEWIRQNFPELRYVESGPPGMNRQAALFRGMYQNDSRVANGPTIQLVPDDEAALTQEAWVTEHVRSGHGDLGADYPIVNQNPNTPRNTRGVKEGDTPSWFFVLPTGLSDPEHPEWGGWGGRFRQDAGGHYVDAEDTHWSGRNDQAVRQKWSVARWRRAYQNDFAARMDWVVRGPREANHPPVPALNGDGSHGVLRIDAAPGDRVTLDARGTSDPDGDRVEYRWWIYEEASTYLGRVAIAGGTSPEASLLVPADAAGKSLHVVLEATDQGEPPLTRYRRAVLQVADRSARSGAPPSRNIDEPRPSTR
jgi:hypothetical protein